MRAYFAQFGAINRLRLSRNRTTGASKHYAFIEFESESVAQIVANTMNNYLMFGHILKCKLVPQDQIHEKLWIGANKRFKRVPWARIEGRKLATGMDKKGWGKRVEVEKKRREAKSKAMKQIGYEFNAGELKAVEDLLVSDDKTEIEGHKAAPLIIEEKKTIVTKLTAEGGTLTIHEEITTEELNTGSRITPVKEGSADKEPDLDQPIVPMTRALEPAKPATSNIAAAPINEQPLKFPAPAAEKPKIAKRKIKDDVGPLTKKPKKEKKKDKSQTEDKTRKSKKVKVKG